MNVTLNQCMIPEKGVVELKINRSFEIKVTAEEARRKVNRWLMTEVSYMIGAEVPTLVIGEQVVWRVPAWIGFPHTGRTGTVGTIDVDVQSGAMDNTPERKAEIERCAETIATRMPPYQPNSALPARYLAKNLPPAAKLAIAKDGYVTFITLAEPQFTRISMKSGDWIKRPRHGSHQSWSASNLLSRAGDV